MAARIKKGDTVLVISGSSKGTQGEVLEVRPTENRAVVRGVAVAKRHQRARRMGEEGGIIAREAPVHLSNLKLVDPASKKPTKVGFRVLEDGRKVRVAKATGEVIEG
ncbi:MULTISPECIES: 50S ribosomal protein L24 [Acetobacter]|jgi:large subunit ribosomal protein L24|uniref:Large ribosomal subunit protein uL24 n=1 Tax=Acetobacter peroxydans TaxID=104098 RepID=A0A4Y3TT90_9PROT|nr:50S ribosomal protein L24 [Acetobacter peroxydans]MCH4093676.1 50S ribosomal protein L24 [Acetobacter peroxydans]MCH4142444.1 50S ribosomal protein L24 [Acetobacter peroxydans]MCI1394076.1 50S ribosomal protein L24 [Acetobacter peroxydans]MCI1410274.1 50S ribosomal protein L24 [Acetobacter peroxydans]MCI1565825.1 50S ribosomal protein L24 [Acetobacter peroxydans]